MNNPFRQKAPPGYPDDEVETFNAQDRIDLLKSFSADQLRAVINLPGVQSTVKQAAERRLRKREKK